MQEIRDYLTGLPRRLLPPAAPTLCTEKHRTPRSTMLLALCISILPLTTDARRECECAYVDAFSSADEGDCRVLDFRTPSCHLNWYSNTSNAVAKKHVQMQTRLSEYTNRNADRFPTLGDFRAPMHQLGGNATFHKFLDNYRVEPSSYHFARGYLAFTEPHAYQLEATIQSVALLLAVSINEQVDFRAVARLLVLLEENAKFLHSRLSGGDDSATPVELTYLNNNNNNDGKHNGRVIDLSRLSCIDWRLVGTNEFGNLTAIMLKTRMSLLEKRRC